MSLFHAIEIQVKASCMRLRGPVAIGRRLINAIFSTNGHLLDAYAIAFSGLDILRTVMSRRHIIKGDMIFRKPANPEFHW
jgi:hypothetical protein